MTCHPIAENAGHWWLCTGRWNRLHAIPGTDLTSEAMRISIDTAEPPTRTAACGLVGRWSMPGLGSRLGLRRCGHCCRALGIAGGGGTPANEKHRAEQAA